MVGSGWVNLGMLSIVVTMATCFVVLRRRAALKAERPPPTTRTAVGLALWLLVTGAPAATGILADFERVPPPFAFVAVGTIAMGVYLGTSSIGRELARLPLPLLVGVQCFRLPLELVMHQAAAEGTMPDVMSFSGYNFDIITGATALPVAWALHRGAPRWLAHAWNAMGAVLLAIVVTIAIAATPVVGAFGPGQLNTWVAHVPFVWLPTVLVVAAMSGHIVIARHLLGAGPRRSTRIDAR